MAELTLEPYAVVQHWHLPAVDGEWESILGEYLRRIALRCISAEKCVIGHIKALSIFPDQSYLRISVVAANIPATVEGKAPTGCINLKLTLNILVYGLERTAIEQIARETADEIANYRKGAVHHHNLGQVGGHLHQSNHHNQY